jgi:hypothetical protein
MLDVHPPHESVHTWKSFFIHIAIISIGLLIALCLEKTVEFFHHRQQAREGMELLLREVNENRKVLQSNAKINEWAEREHRADLGVLQRLRAGALVSGDRLIFIRPYGQLVGSAWRVVHESDAAPYIPYDLMATYTELYDSQEYVNKEANSASYDLQRATAVLNTQRETLTREEEARLQGVIGAQDISTLSAQSFDAAMAKLSGDQDLLRLTPAQVDRLEQGFQQAITDDRRLNRFYLSIAHSYDDAVARSK